MLSFKKVFVLGAAMVLSAQLVHAAVENQLSICDLNRFSRNAHGSRSQEWLYTCTISSSCAILYVLIVWQNFSKNRLLLLI